MLDKLFHVVDGVGNKTCCNDAGGTWKRDCTGGYGKTYYCDSGYTKINDKYCYIKK